MVPPAMLAVLVFAMFLGLGIDSDLAVLIFFYTPLNPPFAICLLFGFCKKIPVEPEETAIVDGASPLQLFFLLLPPPMKVPRRLESSPSASPGTSSLSPCC